MRNSLDPVWPKGEHATFAVPPGVETLSLEVWDHDLLSADDLVGNCDVPLSCAFRPKEGQSPVLGAGAVVLALLVGACAGGGGVYAYGVHVGRVLPAGLPASAMSLTDVYANTLSKARSPAELRTQLLAQSQLPCIV